MLGLLLFAVYSMREIDLPVIAAGQVRPHTGFEVEFREPRNQAGVFQQLETTMPSLGWGRYSGAGASIPTGFQGYMVHHEWTLTDDSEAEVSNYEHVVASWMPESVIHQLEFKHWQKRSAYLTLTDWQEMEQWMNRLGSLFPESNIRIIRHPELFSDPDDLEEFYSATSVPKGASQSRRNA